MSRHLPLVALVLVIVVPACDHLDNSANPEIASHRARFLLDSPPGEAQSIADARAALPDTDAVIVAGRIGGSGDLEPWSEGEATFLITELPSSDDPHAGPGHDPDDCPFCKRRAQQADNSAIVRFVDDQGRTIPIDARQLFDLTAGQKVLVQGTAHIDELDSLVITAEGIYPIAK